MDIYLGYRNETAAGLSYDVGYARYYYPNDGGDCCGEFTVSLGLPVNDQISLSADGAYDPEAEVGTASVGAAYAFGNKFSIYAEMGLTSGGSENEWELGAKYQITDEAAVDLRYYEGSDHDGYVELTLSYDTTLFSR